MVENQINQDASDGDVEPDWHRPAADASMPIPAALKNRHQRYDHERQGDECEQDVSDEKWEIDPRDPTGVAGGFFASMEVINNVANEKTGRGDERDDHAGHVPLPDVAPDPEPAH